MPTPRWYDKQSNANSGIALQNVARFMCNTLGGFTGPAWTCKQVYSAAAAVPWDTPAGNDFTTLPGDNSFKPGNTPAVGDFVVLESASAANKLQIAIQRESATNWRIVVCPKQGWDNAAHNTTVENAANWIQTPIQTVCNLTVPNGVANYSVICDEDVFIPIVEDGTPPTGTYAGKCDQADSLDLTPVVLCTSPSVYVGNWNGGVFRRISPVDNTTEATMYGAPIYMVAIADPYTSANGYLRNTQSGKYVQPPYTLISGTAGHYSTMVLRYISVAWQGILGVGIKTEDTKARIIVNSAAGNGPITILWNSLTAY